VKASEKATIFSENLRPKVKKRQHRKRTCAHRAAHLQPVTLHRVPFFHWPDRFFTDLTVFSLKFSLAATASERWVW
jgi:hypothetical protein